MREVEVVRGEEIGVRREALVQRGSLLINVCAIGLYTFRQVIPMLHSFEMLLNVAFTFLLTCHSSPLTKRNPC